MIFEQHSLGIGLDCTLSDLFKLGLRNALLTIFIYCSKNIFNFITENWKYLYAFKYNF